MKHRLRKFTSALLAFIMVISLFAFVPFTVSAAGGVQSKIDALKSVYYNGSYFTLSGGPCYDSGGNDCKLSNIPSRGGLPAGSIVSKSTGDGWSCWGFAHYAFYYIFGLKAENCRTTSKASLGDYLCMKSSWGAHYAIYIGEDNNNYYVYDSNGDANISNKVLYTHACKKSSWSITKIYHANNYDTINGAVQHTHNYNTYVYYWKSHPHYKCYKCSCGEVKENRNHTTYVDTCPECNKAINNELPIDLGDQFYALIKNQKTGNLFTENDKINEFGNDVMGIPANGEKTQTWLFNRNDDGSYSIKNLASNMYLDVEAGNNINNLTAQPNGTNIITYYKYNGTGNQKFFIYRLFNSYYIRPAGMFRMVDMGISNGLVAVWDYHDDFDPQKFDIIRLDLNNEFPVNLGDQFYALIKNQKTGNLFTENDKINEFGNDVMGMPANGEKTQTWLFNRNDDGSYSIKNLASNMYLDVEAGNNINNLTAQPNGTNIITYYKYNGTGNQRFFIYRLFDSYYLKPVGMNRIVDMGISNGLVAVWDYGENFDPQKFDIIKIEDKNIIGDVNLDGDVDIRDATEIQKHIAQLISLDDEQLKLADTNGDGEVNITDATQIQKSIAQLIPSLG